MGIVNVTPDSFSDGGRFFDKDAAVAHALQLAADGADILDFGAQSTRPGYTELSPAEEAARLQGVIAAVREETALPISVDTYVPEVAAQALSEGADIINDVSGCWNESMALLVKESGAGWVLTHHGAGGPAEVRAFFDKIYTKCINFGIKKEQLCLDFGIGFGKSYEENLAIIANLKTARRADVPALLGVSRKRVIGRASGEEDAAKRIYGNIAAHTVAVLAGVEIVRVHDVKNERKGIRTAEEIQRWIR